MVALPVGEPKIYWTWSLVWRRGEKRPAVLVTVEALTDGVGDLGIDAPDAWFPDGTRTSGRRGPGPPPFAHCTYRGRTRRPVRTPGRAGR